MNDMTAPLAWGLTRGMARTLGVNLTEAVVEGWYSRADLSRLIDTCTACGQTPHCSAWLAVTPRANALPDFCRNKSEIEVLAP